MSDSEVTKLIEQLKSFEKPKDKDQRKRLYDALRELSLDIEDESTSQHRILAAPFETIACRLAIDLKLFDILSQSQEPVSTANLVQETKADPALLIRLLRYLASQHIIKQDSASLWSASNITHALSLPAHAAGLRFGYDCVLPAGLAAPTFFASNSYTSPTSPTQTPFQTAHSTTESAFSWLSAHPSIAADFHTFMAASHAHFRSGLDVLPAAALASGGPPAPVLLVDVGGGTGKTCAELKARFPDLQGRVVNQDTAEAIAQGQEVSGVEHAVHDFFEEQPVKGARFYHLRRVLHDWPDDRCVEILKQVRAAMDADSLVLVDEIVLPDVGAHWFACYADLAMMVCFGARERSLADWKGLLDRAGLGIREVYPYERESGESMVVAVPV